ncbi:MAG: tetratricopeptide repeat protein [bacterium]
MVRIHLVLTVWVLILTGPAFATQDPPASHPNRADIRLLLDQGHYAEAENLARELTAARVEQHGPDSPEVASILDYLVEALYRSGQVGTTEVDSLARTAVALKIAAYGEEHLETATSQYHLGWLRLQVGDLAEAETHLASSLATRERLLAAGHVDIAQSLNGVGALYYYLGEFERAADAFARSLTIRETVLSSDHPQLAISYQNLSNVVAEQGDLVRAEELCRRALAIRRQRFGDEAPPTLDTLYNLSLLLLEQGEYLEAWTMARQVLQVWLATQGEDSYDVALGRHTLALILEKLGDYNEAAQEMSRVTAAFETLLGPDHPELSAFLLNLGVLQYKIGEYNAARASLERALASIEATLGKDHPRYGLGALNLGTLLRDMGDLNEALSWGEEAIRVFVAAHGPEHPKVAEARMAQAGHYHAAGQTEASAAEITQAIGILRANQAGNHPELGRALGHLAASLAQTGDHDAARELLDQAYLLWQNSVGHDHPATAAALSDRGDLALMDGRTTDAVADLTEAYRIMFDVYGNDHPILGTVQMRLAEAYLAASRSHDALAAALATERIGREHLRLSMRLLSERQALMYAQSRASGLDVALSVLANSAGLTGFDGDPPAAVYTELINSRALVQDEMILRSRGLHQDIPDSQAALVRENREIRARLAHLLMREPQEDSPGVLQQQLTFARQEKERTERALARLNLDTGAGHVPEVSLAALAAALRPGERLLSFCRYRHLEPADTTTVVGDHGSLSRRSAYCAFVMSPDRSVSELIEIGDAEVLATAVSAWHREAARGEWRTDRSPAENQHAYRVAADRLRELLWDRVAPQLAHAGVVYVVPDGVLHLVNLATLTWPDGRFLVESGPEIRLLSAERDLLRDVTVPGRGLLVMGDPDFDAVPGQATDPTGSSQLAHSETPAAGQLDSPVTTRGPRRLPDCVSFADRHWERLPGTRAEVETIHQQWRARQAAGGTFSTGESAEKLVGLDATEQQFKARAAGKRIIHVASHGFFLAADCQDGQPDSTRHIVGVPRSTRSLRGRILTENPLLLSGLILTGANRRAESTSGANDGVLTAEEIAGLDLSGVRWAILSACDTGLGEYLPGEGVFGLSRAFRIAGADRLVLSLWPVGDAQAQRWMVELYGGARSLEDEDEMFSVWHTMQRLLAEQRQHGLSTHPFHWGAFVVIGVPGRTD